MSKIYVYFNTFLAKHNLSSLFCYTGETFIVYSAIKLMIG